MSDVQRYLREEEYDLLHDRYHCDLAQVALQKQRDLLQKNLSAARALLEKHQWDGQLFDEGGDHEEEPYCKECFGHKPNHAPDCAIAAQLAGVRGGE